MAKNSKSGFSRKWSAFFALVIILGGVAVSLGFAVRLRDALQRNADTRMITTTEQLRTTVATQLDGYLDSVRSTAAGLSALPAPTKASFTKITAAVAAQKLTAVSTISFLVPAIPGKLGEVEPTWQARGATGLKISPLAGAQQHLFTIFSRGLNGSKASPLGADQVAAPAEVEVARVARTTNKVAISDAYILLADRDLPQAEQQLSFDVLAAVRTGESNKLIGYARLSIRGTQFLTANLSTAAGDLLDVDLLTRSGSGALTQVAVITAGRSQDVRRAETFQAGQRQWVLQTTAANKDLLPTAGRTDMAVLLAGSVLSVMFGTLLYLQMSATARADEEIELEVTERLAAFGLTPADAPGAVRANPATLPPVDSTAEKPNTEPSGYQPPSPEQPATAEQPTGPEQPTAQPPSPEHPTAQPASREQPSAQPNGREQPIVQPAGRDQASLEGPSTEPPGPDQPSAGSLGARQSGGVRPGAELGADGSGNAPMDAQDLEMYRRPVAKVPALREGTPASRADEDAPEPEVARSSKQEAAAGNSELKPGRSAEPEPATSTDLMAARSLGSSPVPGRPEIARLGATDPVDAGRDQDKRAKARGVYVGNASGEITVDAQPKPTNAEPAAAYPVEAEAKPARKRVNRAAVAPEAGEGPQPRTRARKPRKATPAKAAPAAAKPADTTAEQTARDPGTATTGLDQ